MATTKVVTALFNAVSLVAASANVTADITLDNTYGSSLHIKLTNGGTGPTIAAQVQIQTSADDSEYYDFGGPLVGDTVNSAVVSWGAIQIDIGVEYLRLVAGSNTGQAVVVDADISEVTVIDA